MVWSIVLDHPGDHFALTAIAPTTVVLPTAPWPFRLNLLDKGRFAFFAPIYVSSTSTVPGGRFPFVVLHPSPREAMADIRRRPIVAASDLATYLQGPNALLALAHQIADLKPCRRDIAYSRKPSLSLRRSDNRSWRTRGIANAKAVSLAPQPCRYRSEDNARHQANATL